jgi:hypothetical protein
MRNRSSESLHPDRINTRCFSAGSGTESSPSRRSVLSTPSFVGSSATQRRWLTFDSGIAGGLWVVFHRASSLLGGWRPFAFVLSGIRSCWPASSSMSGMRCGRGTCRRLGFRLPLRNAGRSERDCPCGSENDATRLSGCGLSQLWQRRRRRVYRLLFSVNLVCCCEGDGGNFNVLSSSRRKRLLLLPERTSGGWLFT